MRASAMWCVSACGPGPQRRWTGGTRILADGHDGEGDNGCRGDERDFGGWDRRGAGADGRVSVPSAAAPKGDGTGSSPEFDRPTLRLIAHEGFPYPAALRRAVLAAMNAERTSTAELARLNWRLGLEYARAVRDAAEKHGAKVELIGCHGQTMYHQGKTAAYAGRSFACTWQAGEPALLAAEMGVPVVSNFRAADMAAGGQGAPLVPLLDYVLFADRERGRVLQNIGGIANLTSIPAGAGPGAVVAFDTGPGNMVMDWLAGELLGKKFDRDGRAAARGRVIAEVVAKELRSPYYKLKPPKSAGREEFGAEYAERFLMECGRFSAKAEDALATATALTAETIVQSYARFVAPGMKSRAVDYIVSGGGARNSCADGDAARAAGAAGMHAGRDWRIRDSGGGQGGGGVCAAGVDDVESQGGECARGDGSGARGGAGVGDACVSCARTPTHRAIGQRDGWGTALCDGDAGPSTRVPCGNACSG